MKILLIAMHICALYFVLQWLTNFEQAQKQAAEKHELILLNFSGSDWCSPCIRLRKEIFESESFNKKADGNLVLVDADFPRLKKNRLSEQLQKQNDRLAEKYNRDGHFPYTLLLDAKGNVLKSWEGYPREGATAFINELQTEINDNH